MKFTGLIDDALDEMAVRIEDSTDDIAVTVFEEAQRWSLTHLRQHYVTQERYLHAFLVDCMIRCEVERRDTATRTRFRTERGLTTPVHYNGELLVPADPTILHEYMGSDL